MWLLEFSSYVLNWLAKNSRNIGWTPSVNFDFEIIDHNIHSFFTHEIYFTDDSLIHIVLFIDGLLILIILVVWLNFG